MADKKKEKAPEKKEIENKNLSPEPASAPKNNGLDTRSLSAEPLFSDAVIGKLNSFLFFAGVLFLIYYWAGNYVNGDWFNVGSCSFSLDRGVKTEVQMIYPDEEVSINFEPCREVQLAPDKPVTVKLLSGKKFLLKSDKKFFRIREDGSIDDKNEIENLGEIPGLTLLVGPADNTETKLIITTWRK